MKLEEEPPIFSKQKVNFSPTDRITHLAVSSDLLVLTMANSVLLRIDLRHPDNPQGNVIWVLCLLTHLLFLREIRDAHGIFIRRPKR
jgi:hypothetical protein